MSLTDEIATLESMLKDYPDPRSFNRRSIEGQIAYLKRQAKLQSLSTTEWTEPN